MDINKILVIIIVILISIIVIVGGYFLALHLLNKKRKKKIENVFNPTNLVEEESLMNFMDEKRNLEYVKQQEEDNKFIVNQPQQEVDIIVQGPTREEQVNPFGVDMTMHNQNNVAIEVEDQNKKKNKFIN